MWVFLTLIFIHWICDFVFQTHKMSTNKSFDNWYLSLHVSVYTLLSMFFWSITLPFFGVTLTNGVFLVSMLVMFGTHWITDYFTSKITSKLYKQERYQEFFVIIGLDQFLHYVQIFTIYTYIILNK